MALSATGIAKLRTQQQLLKLGALDKRNAAIVIANLIRAGLLKQ